MVHNADAAIERACRQTGAAVANYTVAPVYATATTKGRHEWLIEFDRRPADMERCRPSRPMPATRELRL